ncbi:MAG: folate-binding protein YgfZ [Gammaproteobacteria bacterium]
MSAGTFEAFDLDHLALIDVRGADARAFLAAQLTSDLRRVTPAASQLSAWCTAQGRVIATLRVVEMDAGFVLVLARDLVEPVLRRLRMFVLRSKVTLAAAAELAVFGVRGAPPGWAPDALPRDVDGATRFDSGVVVRVHGTPMRHLLLAQPATIDRLRTAARTAGSLRDALAWRHADIDAGIAHVALAASEQFLPQMLNLDCVGAVAFDKGCYPGQEVVARLKYRGQLKRRMYRAWSAAAATPAPNARLAVIAGDAQDHGNVVDAVPGGDGRQRMSVVLPIALADARIGLDDADTAPVDVEPVPYPLAD